MRVTGIAAAVAAASRTVRRPRHVTAEFCESCAEVCTPACRAEARLDRLRTAALASGFRL